MSFKAIHENKILAKNSDVTVTIRMSAFHMAYQYILQQWHNLVTRATYFYTVPIIESSYLPSNSHESHVKYEQV